MYCNQCEGWHDPLLQMSMPLGHIANRKEWQLPDLPTTDSCAMAVAHLGIHMACQVSPAQLQAVS